MKCQMGLLLLLWISTNVLAQDFALKRLQESPRHQEWVLVEHDNRKVHAFVVYPEVKEKVLAVLVIHENRGLSDWVRSMADQLAEAGFVAIAPDLLSGAGPDGGKTSDFPDSDAAREAIYQLQPEQVTADLNAVFDYVSKLPACNGKVVVSGFCWGGSQTWRFATRQSKVNAAFVFYGTGPGDDEAIARINCPVYGFYGGNDARVNATLPKSKELMQASKKSYEPVTYEGARHAFMRRGEGPKATPANKKARDEAWNRWLSLLKKI